MNGRETIDGPIRLVRDMWEYRPLTTGGEVESAHHHRRRDIEWATEIINNRREVTTIAGTGHGLALAVEILAQNIDARQSHWERTMLLAHKREYAEKIYDQIYDHITGSPNRINISAPSAVERYRWAANNDLRMKNLVAGSSLKVVSAFDLDAIQEYGPHLMVVVNPQWQPSNYKQRLRDKIPSIQLVIVYPGPEER